MAAPGYVPRAVRRVKAIREALLVTAIQGDMEITTKDVERLATSVVEVVYPRNGIPVPPDLDATPSKWQRSGVGRNKRIQPHQIEYLRMMANGLTIDEMALAVNRSRNTVKTHLQTVYRSLGAENQSHAVAIALKTGLVPWDDVIIPSDDGFPC